jgi:hypothetical protein
MRLLSPDHACVSVDTGPRRYDGTVIDVSSPSEVRALREVGYTPADVSGGPAKASGHKCERCGFIGWFRLCGRCGSGCESEAA